MFLGFPDPDPLVRDMDPDPDPALDLRTEKLQYIFKEWRNESYIEFEVYKTN